ncbi:MULTISPECIES: PucR family transcriptional regulator [Streptomyces]|uniref:Helix-turn-helix domain-containing protein n=2 Tax=Streptomyces TaxID=1883 RepID=A0ABY9J561_9ACTN|nr:MULTISPECIES: helix-turn-helix domain-containing protein [unclassified Streptomyces]WLQ62977.1 helix-turn-helix domain-containing protein [Streptomyces sp. Alt3]WSQ76490.1 helix-turn-helix domain-containing protein [Streptomyces sp. NBC_01213]WSR10234.1 helix-turn-helix domain-containing protein [Streptomyces sp. NBC_01208]WSR47067.1 helix-turn-helix domain-containing protein [Streptomyces sp. NBC_01201]
MNCSAAGRSDNMRRRGDERGGALLDALLEGRAEPGLAARAASGLGVPEQGRYAVAVLRAGLGGPAGVAMEAEGLRFFRRERADRECVVVALGDRDPAALVALLVRCCPGPGGVGPVADGLAGLGTARRLAELALLTCPPGTTEIVRLEERLPTALVVSQPELSARLVADVFGPLLALDPADRALLVRTLEAWLECGGSAGRAAGRLYCHRNTVLNRLRRLERLTSRSLSRPRELIEMMLALDAFRLTAPYP